MCTYGCVHEHFACLCDFEDDTSESIKYSGRPRCLAALDSEDHPQDHTGTTWQIIYEHLKFICFEQRETNLGIHNTFVCSFFFTKYLLLAKTFGKYRYWFASPQNFWEACRFSFSKALLCVNAILANSYSTAIFLDCQTCPEPRGCICLKAESEAFS